MSPDIIILLLITGAAFVVWFIFFRKGNIGFWKLASKYPNEAYDWFMKEDCWIVIEPQSGQIDKPDPNEFNGPFRLNVPKLGGKVVTIYGRFDEIEESQERFLKLNGRKPSKTTDTEKKRNGKYDPLVWEANKLAIVSLPPFIEHFPQFKMIVDSNLMEEWDRLMTIALTGVAAHTKDILSSPEDREELKSSVEEWFEEGGDDFDNYYEYVSLQTTAYEASWTGVSAVWVTSLLASALKSNVSKVALANPIAAFLNISFGEPEVGISRYLGEMALEVEQDLGIDMGLGTKGTKTDTDKKIVILGEIFDSYARNTLKYIKEVL